MQKMPIREMTGADLALIAMLVSESNKDVAASFGLHAENCPKHPSFCTESWGSADVARGDVFHHGRRQWRGDRLRGL